LTDPALVLKSSIPSDLSEEEPGVPDDVDPPATTLERSRRPADPVAGVQEALRRRWARPGGRLYAGLRWGGATIFAAIASPWW